MKENKRIITKSLKSYKEVYEFCKKYTKEDIGYFIKTCPSIYTTNKNDVYNIDNKQYSIKLDLGMIESSLKDLKFRSEFIEEARKEKKISYKYLAKLINMEESELKRMINNKQRCSLTLDELEQLSMWLGLMFKSDKLFELE